MAQQLFELLKRDHRQVEKWMSQIEDGPESKREDLFTTLQDALEKHMQMEEKHFYPQIKKIKEMKDLAADALEEHETTKKFLLQLEDIDFDDDEWITNFQEMREGILHHVGDEEKKIFPGCVKFMDEKILKEIGVKCTEEKERAQPSRGPSGGKKQKR